MTNLNDLLLAADSHWRISGAEDINDSGVIDGLLSEVNVTSPTGLRQLTELGGGRPDLEVVRWLEHTVAH